MADSSWVLRLDGATLPDKADIGGKAWSIARMRALGLPVPPAFVIPTSACREFLKKGALPSGLETQLDAGIVWLEAQTGRKFGGAEKPLLLSVRSGASISMPGMMDTVLNLGMNDVAQAALAHESGSQEFARDTHRRFRELYASIVLKETAGESALMPPSSAHQQLLGAVRAVFESWNARRARRYREHNHIPHDLGTAVTIQAMVFGNLDERSGTGVVFSRNPLSGERTPYGEYLPRAQGEDVVSGRFTPLPLDAMSRREPQAYAALLEATGLLEREHGDMQDIEFTVQAGQLYLLQSRSAKRAPHAAVRTGRRYGGGRHDRCWSCAVTRQSRAGTFALAAAIAQGCGRCGTGDCERRGRLPGCRLGRSRLRVGRSRAARGNRRGCDPVSQDDESRGYPWHDRGARSGDRTRWLDLARGQW